MADQGLPSGGSIGYEIFDDSDSLGTTNFVQNVNLVRALEGELARSIRTLSSVNSARVHLVMPKRQLFSRERRQPSASVILKMNGPGRLEKPQVMAIQHLVAAAVPSLAPGRISIVDGKGTLLARGFEDANSESTTAAKANERRRIFENRVARTIEELLERTVGFGKVRAEVSSEMDFDRISTNEEQFDPEGQVVRSTQTVEETSNARDAENDSPVSIGTNLPDPSPAAGGASSSANESRVEETVNFEVSKKVINHVRESGTVKRLSVAVLVDGTRKAGADGDLVYQPRNEAEMELLATLVRNTIGFNADRGDKVDVINMEFAAGDDKAEEPLQLFFGLDKNDLLRTAEFLVLGIVAILVILLVIRPLVSRALDAIPAAVASADARLLADQSTGTGTPALTGPGSGALAGPRDGAPGENDAYEELIDIDRVEGRVKASSVKKVGEIVEKHPEEAISIVRSWMYQES
jgi:flagellar M-ring protein FliF